jgi:hypothetical protein
MTAQATGLVLCTRGTLGKGTLCMYPSLRVPTHPFRVLCLSALGKYLGEFSVCKYQDLTATWCAPRDACFGNLLNSLGLGARQPGTYRVLPCHQSRKVSFPLLETAALSRYC